ncbi:MAG: phosphoglycerate kinase [Dethiobacter sp.]|nr:MAG: phosphoglycerate kinase [Dethiobacter sp.]
MSKLTVKDIPAEGKRVFVRVDFNVPLSPEGRVLDDTKIRASLPTIRYLLEKGSRLILASHLGRPKGKVVEALRMDPVAERLSRLLGREVLKSNTVVGEEVVRAVEALKPGDILLLENIRFEAGEEKNDPQFAAALARLADFYVNDAFGTAHRAHASTNGISRFLPAVAGLLMEKEIVYLYKSRENPPSPLVAILGGKKVADKIGVIRHFMGHADSLLLGGAMANTFLKARGYVMGSSFYEEDKLDLAREILEEAPKNQARIYLPSDVVIVEELRARSPFKVVKAENIPEGWSAVDIGPETVDTFQKAIHGAKMIIWNGPLGAYEFPPFHKGTEMVARSIAAAKAESIVGGGDIVAALEELGLSDQITHLSTGGGAVLEFWEGKELPGLTVLQEHSLTGI